MNDSDQSAERNIQRMLDENKVKKGHYMDNSAPKFHLILEASAYNDASTVEGQCLVEHPNGVYKKATGEELIRIADAYPFLIKDWRLPE